MIAQPLAAAEERRGSATGQFERFTPSRLSDGNGFVEETLAGTGATDGNAPVADLGRLSEKLKTRAKKLCLAPRRRSSMRAA